MTEQEENFLVDYTWNGDIRKLPRFSGLPTIHIKPTKFIPIIPYHSFPGEATSKMLWHLLKDEIKSTPTMLLNSRTLAQELHQIQLPFGQKVFMLSADVEAFHPNVLLNAINDVVQHATTKHHKELKGQLGREFCSVENNYLVFR